PPTSIPRAVSGSTEGFSGVLLDHSSGASLAWLAPHQVVGIPVSADNVEPLKQVIAKLRKKGIRAEVDTSDDRMQKKIRNHTTGKVPFMLLAGARDVEADAVSFRFLDGSQANGIQVDEAVELIAAWIAERENNQPTQENIEARRTQTA